jgi:hypothetical protein
VIIGVSILLRLFVLIVAPLGAEVSCGIEGSMMNRRISIM